MNKIKIIRYLTGNWRLQEWVATLPDGSFAFPLGKDAIGYLMYSQEGFIAVSLMAADYPNQDPLHPLAPNPIEFPFPYLSYFATYELISESEIHHYVKASSVPKMVGTCQIRTVKIVDENTLVLSTLSSEERGQVNTLTWIRIGKDDAR